jgi:hypothetical protein
VVLKPASGVRIRWDLTTVPLDDKITAPAGILLIKGDTRIGHLRYRR